MPTYFSFLTLMAFKLFLDEKVDVAIIEVGIGGEFDCTNILRLCVNLLTLFETIMNVFFAGRYLLLV